MIPYRQATLVRSAKIGTVYILHFNLGKFALSSNLDEFQLGLPGDSPHWTGESKLSGFWCQGLQEPLASVDETDSLEHWQTIAKQLKARKAFAGESYFCTIDGLSQSNSETKIAPVKGQYVLGADKDFELRIFHYDPDTDAHSGYKATRWLRLAAVEPGVQLRSTPLLAIDSPYDLKSVQIRTGSTLANQYSSFSVERRIESR